MTNNICDGCVNYRKIKFRGEYILLCIKNIQNPLKCSLNEKPTIKEDEIDCITLIELSEITGLHDNTLRTFLSRDNLFKYHFRKTIDNREKTVYALNDNFIQELYDFLNLRRLWRKADLLKSFWKKYKKEKGIK